MEAPWFRCAGPCEEARPVFCWFFKEPQKKQREPNPENADPYCQECAAYRIELEVFPTPLADIPIVFRDSEDGES